MIDLNQEIKVFPEKNPGSEPLHIGVIYPNNYPTSLASLGFQTVLRIACSTEGIIVHRIVPEDDKGQKYPDRTLEENLAINSLDALLVSCSFEIDYIHLLRILDQSKINPLRTERGGLPLIIVGGIAPTANPEPLAMFADAIGIGEAEEMLPQILDALIEYYPLLTGRNFQTGRDALYEAWQAIEGVYVPAFWDGKSGDSAKDHPENVAHAYVRDINCYPSYSPIISPLGTYGAKNLIEINRGCETHCRFCLLSYISPPGRERSISSILQNARLFPPDKASVGLLSSNASDHKEIVPIINTLAEDGYIVSVSSLKISSTTSEVLHSLAKAGAKSVTFAPEHGSEKIRQLVNKLVSYEDVKSRIEWAFEAGITKIKLYFLTGFEEESEEDLSATTEFILSLASDTGLTQKSHYRSFTIGIASFVPKACTPFQRRSMQNEKTLKKKITRIIEPLRKHPRIEIEIESPRVSIIQGVLSQAGREISPLLIEMGKSRGPILTSWDEIIAKSGKDPAKKILEPRSLNEVLPWSFIKRTYHV